MSTLKCDSLQNTAGTKTVPVSTVVDGSAKAWVNFNGVGTVAIRSSFNVSSIIDNGIGDYTVNFSTPFPDNIYCAILGGGDTNNIINVAGSGGQTASSVKIHTREYNNPLQDTDYVAVAIFR